MGIFFEVGRTAIAATLAKEELAWWNNKDRDTMTENLGVFLKGWRRRRISRKRRAEK